MEKREGIRWILFGIFAVFLLSFVIASYDFNDYSIKTTYSKGSSISGNIEISFANESVNTPFTDSLGNSATIKDLLSVSQGYSHTCGYPNCEPQFTESSSGTTFSFPLSNGNYEFYGIIFRNLNLNRINSASFELQSDAVQSASNQISVDFFNDEEIDAKNTNAGTSFDFDNFGCFNSSQTQTEVTLTTDPYCQKISFHEAPGLKLGAWVKETVSGTRSISMYLYDEEGDYLEGCLLPKGSMTSSGGRVFCDVDIEIPQNGTYYSCLRGGLNGTGEYKTRGFSQSENCGFQGLPPKAPVYTYEIGGAEKYFGSVGTLTIGDTLTNGENLSEMVEDYIISKYGSLDCSGKDCIVPIKLISSKDQSITLKNFNINYDFTGGSGASTNVFYKLNEDPSKINSPRGNLSLGTFFKLPNEEIELDYTFYYDGDLLFDEEISVEDFNIRLYPLKSAALFPTDFTAIVPEELDPVLYTWEFGDNNSQITSVPQIRHTYSEVGNYTFTLKVLTNIGEIPSTFNIEVGSPEEVLSYEIQKRKENLEDFESSLLPLSIFEENEVQKLVNLSHLKLELETIEDETAIATTDQEYAFIISKLLNLSFPNSLSKSLVRESFYLPTETSIDLDALSSITGKNYNETQGTYDYIIFWNQDNLDSNIKENDVVINWDDQPKSVIRFFELNIRQSKSLSEDYYFVVRDLPGLSFEEGNFENISGYKYREISSSNERISFSTTETTSVSNLMFISPGTFEVQEIGPIEEAGNNIWILILGLAGVLLLGLLVYLVLHRWYEVKYEKYLFPDKNHLYNAIFYINNSVKNGMEEYEIRKNLLNVGWKGEQVSYLMKKYAGKRTGMVDIFGFMKKNEGIPTQGPPKPGFNSEYQERGKYTKFNKY